MLQILHSWPASAGGSVGTEIQCAPCSSLLLMLLLLPLLPLPLLLLSMLLRRFETPLLPLLLPSPSHHDMQRRQAAAATAAATPKRCSVN